MALGVHDKLQWLLLLSSIEELCRKAENGFRSWSESLQVVDAADLVVYDERCETEDGCFEVLYATGPISDDPDCCTTYGHYLSCCLGFPVRVVACREDGDDDNWFVQIRFDGSPIKVSIYDGLWNATPC